jgi:hypothetical protein
LNVVGVSLGNPASSHIGEDEQDDEDDQEDTEKRKPCEDDEPGCMMGAITQTDSAAQ